jgi:hypothetical protein
VQKENGLRHLGGALAHRSLSRPHIPNNIDLLWAPSIYFVQTGLDLHIAARSIQTGAICARPIVRMFSPFEGISSIVGFRNAARPPVDYVQNA